MKIRVKFSKYGAMRFVGHLDMMRYFQKAFRRANIDMKYTEGYNPHMVLSFASPLGIGVSSEAEYLDIEVQSTKTSQQAVADLNAVMADGVRVLSYLRLPDSAKKAMSLVAAADYKAFFKDGCVPPGTAQSFQTALDRFWAKRDRIPVLKPSKHGEREVDIKPWIYGMSVQGDASPAFFFKLSAGSVDNLKPELLLSELISYCGYAYHPWEIQVHRLETYAKNERGEFVPLDSMGESIV